MVEGWKEYKLVDITSVITKGTTPSTYGFKFQDFGINYIRSQCLSYDGSFDENAFTFITIEAQNKLKRSQLKKDDVLLSMAGANLGMVGMVRDHFLPANTNQAVGIIRIDNPEILPSIVEYLLRDPRTTKYIHSQSGQSAQPNINLTEIGNLSFKFPPLPEQKAIASILSALDDKIELNLQMNKTLEEMAMALYKHWFVDFGPFQDGKFVDSELGMIPEGWEVKKLGDIISVVSKGTTPRKRDVDGLTREIPFLKVKDIDDLGVIRDSSLELIPRQVHENQLKRSILQVNDILFSIAGTIGRVSIVPDRLQFSNCNQALAFIRLKDKTMHLPLVYYWFKSSNTKRKIISSIVQGVQANVSLTILKELEILIPSLPIIESFNSFLCPIIEEISSNRIENILLSKLRNSILPKLISGEVRLKEFQKTVEQVL